MRALSPLLIVALAVAFTGGFTPSARQMGLSMSTQSMPGCFTTDVGPGPYQFASATSGDTYEAVTPSKNRRSAGAQIRPEDKVLDRTARIKLAANSIDLHRNAVLFAWAVRRHLDYTTLFDFQPMSKDKGLNKEWSELMARDCMPENCDVGGRHSWNRMRRLAEVRKILDGDCGLLTLRSGKLQGIESHMIRNPQMTVRDDANRWEQGIKKGAGRKAMAYCLEDRDEFNKKTERIVPAGQLMVLGSFEGRFDQMRGISPVAAALSDFRDVYETKALMQAKIKLEQIFGVAFIRDIASESLADEFGYDGDPENEDEATAEASEQHGPPPSYDLGQDIKGFDLNKGEDVKLIQSSNPSANQQEFLMLSIAIAIKALDLPFNFFDESRTNFFGSKAAWLQYDRACVYKREDQLELHRRYTIWRNRRWLLPTAFGGTGELILPRSMSETDLRWKWVPRGMPWWNPQEELTVDMMAVAAGLKTLQQVCDERGLGIWTDNLERLADEFAAAQELGFTLAFQQAKLPLSITFNGAPKVDSGKPAPEVVA